MMGQKRLFLTTLILMLISFACNLPSANQGGEATIMAETVAAQLTQALATIVVSIPSVTPTFPEQATYTPLPTYTLPATYTAVFTASPPPTATTVSTPCNWASFVSDVTYPDGSEVTVGTGFVKTWRLKNIGTCTWTSGYSLVFDHGDRMSAPDAVALTGGTVPPGGTVDVSVSLIAPGSEGTYQGYFRLRAPDGSIFGIGSSASGPFWAKIKAVSVAPPPPAGMPDLRIPTYTVNPSSITLGSSVDVTVTVKNAGTANAGPFQVVWWSGQLTIAPQKIWDVPGLAAGATMTLTYTYSGYTVSSPDPWQSSAVVDWGGSVAESNESNNTQYQNVSVVLPLLPIITVPIPFPFPGP